ncbi:Imm47 family immunity protein [Brevibacillus brevis]|nr:Imm47 family immunity protein [Brevibacillus brevis]
MEQSTSISNNIWFGQPSSSSPSTIKENLLRATTEHEALFHLIELFKLGDFTQKRLLFQLMNYTNDEALLNLCIRVFCSISTHEDLRDSNHLLFLGEGNKAAVDTFASEAITTLSLEVIPYLMALLEEWDSIRDTSVMIRDSIDCFINFKEHLGDNATVDEIGEYYKDFMEDCDAGQYYYHQNLSFLGDLTKILMQRVFIAANHEQMLRMELIPSLLSTWSGEKVPGDYHTVITNENYKDYVSYVKGLANKKWEKGQKYFYGHPL